MSKVWFITGSSRGFGRELVRAALDTGDAVAATARRPEQLADLATTYGERILALPLDVTDAAAAAVSIVAARERFGRLDVVVNNAGYANVAPIETGDDEDFRAQFETNFWGVYNVSKAAIPALRGQGGGLIIQFSSMGGRVGRYRVVPGRKVRDRRVLPCSADGNGAVRHQDSRRRTQRVRPTGLGHRWRLPTSRTTTSTPSEQ
jgi:NAD(P)-dependent dehydrogenase (short-subunit alcohol dehydrogenase family)